MNPPSPCQPLRTSRRNRPDHPPSRAAFLPGRLGLVWMLASLCAGCWSGPSPNDPQTLVPILVELLHDEAAPIRQSAARSLGKIQPGAGVAALVEAVRDDDPRVREASAWALSQIWDPVKMDGAPMIVEALGDPDPGVRHAAARALAAFGSTPSVVAALLENLRHPDVNRRRSTVQALALIEAPAAYDTLIHALEDPDARVRQGAIAALGELGDPRALRAISERLHADRDPGVRSEAAFRTGKLGDATLAPSLREALRREVDPSVRRWLAWALEELGEPQPSSG